ncbi:hypothetical protein LguiA_015214 [Lonicera macranthoides]
MASDDDADDLKATVTENGEMLIFRVRRPSMTFIAHNLKTGKAYLFNLDRYTWRNTDPMWDLYCPHVNSLNMGRVRPSLLPRDTSLAHVLVAVNLWEEAVAAARGLVVAAAFPGDVVVAAVQRQEVLGHEQPEANVVVVVLSNERFEQ